MFTCSDVTLPLCYSRPFVARKGAFEGKDKCFNWTLEYLSEKCREREVIVRKDTRKMDYRTGKRLPIVKMQFCDCKAILLSQTQA